MQQQLVELKKEMGSLRSCVVILTNRNVELSNEMNNQREHNLAIAKSFLPEQRLDSLGNQVAELERKLSELQVDTARYLTSVRAELATQMEKQAEIWNLISAEAKSQTDLRQRVENLERLAQEIAESPEGTFYQNTELQMRHIERSESIKGCYYGSKTLNMPGQEAASLVNGVTPGSKRSCTAELGDHGTLSPRIGSETPKRRGVKRTRSISLSSQPPVDVSDRSNGLQDSQDQTVRPSQIGRSITTRRCQSSSHKREVSAKEVMPLNNTGEIGNAPGQAPPPSPLLSIASLPLSSIASSRSSSIAEEIVVVGSTRATPQPQAEQRRKKVAYPVPKADDKAVISEKESRPLRARKKTRKVRD